MSLPSTDALTTGYFFSACDRRLDEERHEAELDAVLLLELVLVLVAQVHHRLHVHFVERRQDRVGRLRLQQALGDAGAQTAHRHALFRTVARFGDDRRSDLLQRRLVERAGAGAGSGRLASPARRARRPWSRGRPCRCPRLRAGHAVFGQDLGCGGHRDAALQHSRQAAPQPAAAAWRGPLRRVLRRPVRQLRRRWLRYRSWRSLRRQRTVLPSPLTISTITPAPGAGSSSTTLSVSMSIRFSSRATASPTFLCHCSRVASATDSDSCGTFTST